MKRYALPIALVAALAVWTGCKHSQAEGTEATTFVLSDTMMASITIDTTVIKPVENELRLSGKVTPDMGKVLKLYPLVSGYVKDIKVQLGDYVKKGQVLAVIQSGEIADYDKQLSQAQSDLAVAEKGLKVAQDLYKSQLATEKDVVNAEGEASKAKAEIGRINELLQIYRKGSGSTSIVTAPISGYVIEKNINNGMELRSDNSSHMFTISELDDVWIMANVFETDISRVKEGYPADISTISYPDKIFHGRIDKVYNVLDPDTKTMQVRIRLDNEGMLLKPEMFASVLLRYREGMEMPAIPSSAVIFDKGKNFVMVFRDKFNIDTREIKVAKALNETSYISRGLQPGEKIISRNQLLIYDALND
ncbi:efflux RND transporter periplasmic adaptor subunit [Chitinophaga sp. GCM10012297]|uniref:Efflux RND transporter periplasmic adaptor subunit n=1 Tax=Chitinophaga chungangae TaxID=2821488 RepID=A0ABS3YHW9_9BACT|nr:efflux RND transporter periplasmic adaptor subunit [Chitinophaga chungangae]MBO9154287.1 efflux RND transporter periplasmic adaptor subunit [Chitinophaga chungangae]